MFIFFIIGEISCYNWRLLFDMVNGRSPLIDLMDDLNLFPDENWDTVQSKCRFVCLFSFSMINKITNRSSVNLHQSTQRIKSLFKRPRSYSNWRPFGGICQNQANKLGKRDFKCFVLPISF